jgi:hypothetical protein
MYYTKTVEAVKEYISKNYKEERYKYYKKKKN